MGQVIQFRASPTPTSVYASSPAGIGAAIFFGAWRIGVAWLMAFAAGEHGSAHEATNGPRPT